MYKFVNLLIWWFAFVGLMKGEAALVLHINMCIVFGNIPSVASNTDATMWNF